MDLSAVSMADCKPARQSVGSPLRSAPVRVRLPRWLRHPEQGCLPIPGACGPALAQRGVLNAQQWRPRPNKRRQISEDKLAKVDSVHRRVHPQPQGALDRHSGQVARTARRNRNSGFQGVGLCLLQSGEDGPIFGCVDAAVRAHGMGTRAGRQGWGRILRRSQNLIKKSHLAVAFKVPWRTLWRSVVCLLVSARYVPRIPWSVDV